MRHDALDIRDDGSGRGIRPRQVHRLTGQAIGQPRGTHARRLSEQYVGEWHDDQIVDKHLGNLGNIGNRGNPGNTGIRATPATGAIAEVSVPAMPLTSCSDGAARRMARMAVAERGFLVDDPQIGRPAEAVRIPRNRSDHSAAAYTWRIARLKLRFRSAQFRGANSTVNELLHLGITFPRCARAADCPTRYSPVGCASPLVSRPPRPRRSA